MTQYRLKLIANEISEADEHTLEYASDEAALDDAAFLGHSGEIEVWQDARLVGRFVGVPGAPD